MWPLLCIGKWCIFWRGPKGMSLISIYRRQLKFKLQVPGNLCNSKKNHGVLMTLLKINAIQHFAGLANGKPTYTVITCLALLTLLAGTLHA